jgi:MFS family permease
MTDQAPAPASRRNFRLSVLNGALMIGTSNSVASPELVLTAFAASLTSNPVILGLIAPVQTATWSLPQFWIVGWVQRARRVLPMYTYAAVVRLAAWVALTLTVLLSHDSSFLLVTLLAFVLVGGMAAGLAGLPFIEVVGKVIPPRQRGLAFGWRGALGGVLAIVGAQVVILFTGPSAHFDFPTNYGLLFLVAGLAQMLGFFAFSLVIEPPSTTRTEHLKPSLDVVRTIWRSDGNFRRFVGGRTMFELSNTVNGLIIVYASQVLGVRLELAGLYLLVSSVLRPIFSVAAGRLSVRIGNRIPVAAGLLAQGLGWTMLLIALPLGVRERAAEYYMIPVYSLTAIQRGLVFSNLMALALNVTPSGERPLYMGALNTWIGVVGLAGLLSGVMAEVIGFEALFALTAVMSCVGAWQFWTLREQWEGVAETT